MDSNALSYGKNILDQYLETSNCRKTAERYAILEAVYALEGHFTMKQLNDFLLDRHFRVSRATLYNTMKLFQQLRLIVSHHLNGGTTYETILNEKSHCHRICTECGRVQEINIPVITSAFNEAKIKRFRKETFTMYIYGICSSCQAKMTRMGTARIQKQ